MVTSFVTGKPRRGNPFWRGLDNVWETDHHEDEIRSYSDDWSDRLDPSEALVSVTAEDSGVTSSAVSVSGANLLFTIEGTGGSVEFTVVTNQGTRVEIYRFVPRPTDRLREDYAGA